MAYRQVPTPLVDATNKIVLIVPFAGISKSQIKAYRCFDIDFHIYLEFTTGLKNEYEWAAF